MESMVIGRGHIAQWRRTADAGFYLLRKRRRRGIAVDVRVIQ